MRPERRRGWLRTKLRGRPLRAVMVVAVVMLVLPLPRAIRIVRYEPPALAPTAPADGLTRARLGIHVHTEVNDGRGSFEEVVAAARKAGLQVLVVTDHDSWSLRSREGYHDGLLVLVGAELSTDDGHVLALGGEALALPATYETAACIADVKHAGGLALAAHPGRSDGLRWATSLDFVDGLEAWNVDSAWRRSALIDLSGAIAAYPFAPARAVAAAMGDDAASVLLWSQESGRRPLLKIAAADAHGMVASYESVLGAVVNVLLLEAPLVGQLEPDRAAVIAALRARRVVLARPPQAPAEGATLVARRAGVRVAVVGDASVVGPVELELTSGIGVEADLRILAGSEVVAATIGKALRVTVDGDGSYHGEIRLPGPFAAPWLMTNAITLGSPTIPSTVQAMTGEVGRSLLADLALEHDPRTTAALRPSDGPLVLDYTLGRDAADVWWALIARGEWDLSANSGLVVAASADRALRLDIAIEVAEGRGRERYRKSLRLGPEPVRVEFPLATFRSRDGARKEGPDLTSVRAILITMDQGVAAAGSGAQIRVEGLWLR